MRQWQRVACAAIVLTLCAARFAGLSETPAGFYLDEAAGAANILCIAESGISEQGERLPLFFPEFPGTGTFFTPVYIYSGAAWTKLFGTSIAALRAHVALYAVITIAAVFAVARRFIGTDGALFAALAAAVSPWGFLFSRIAWDPPLAACFTMWGVYFALRKSTLASAISGLLLAVAMYTYAPARVFVPGLLVLLWIVERPRVSHAIAQLAALAAAIVPLAVLTLDGTLQTRVHALAIWNREWLQAVFGDASALRVAQAFVTNFVRHLSPDFLILRGDANPRHGAHMFGLLSWLDVLAVTGFAAARGQSSGWRKLLVLAAGGWLGAFAVTSLSWDGIPHALRSIVGWPFLALMTGALLAAVCARWRVPAYAVLVCAVAFSAMFLHRYFTTYRETSAPAFDAVVREQAEVARQTGEWQQLYSFADFYPVPAVRYYVMRYRGASCEESRTLLSRK